MKWSLAEGARLGKVNMIYLELVSQAVVAQRYSIFAHINFMHSGITQRQANDFNICSKKKSEKSGEQE